MQQITIDDFAKVEARLGRVISAEKVEGSDKLIRFMLDFGQKEIVSNTEVTPEETETETVNEEQEQTQNEHEENRDIRQILSGIQKWYGEPEKLVGKTMLFCVNLAPRKMAGLESHGMLMAVDGLDGQPVFLVPDQEVAPGAKIH